MHTAEPLGSAVKFISSQLSFNLGEYVSSTVPKAGHVLVTGERNLACCGIDPKTLPFPWIIAESGIELQGKFVAPKFEIADCIELRVSRTTARPCVAVLAPPIVLGCFVLGF